MELRALFPSSIGSKKMRWEMLEDLEEEEDSSIPTNSLEWEWYWKWIGRGDREEKWEMRKELKACLD